MAKTSYLIQNQIEGYRIKNFVYVNFKSQNKLPDNFGCKIFIGELTVILQLHYYYILYNRILNI